MKLIFLLMLLQFRSCIANIDSEKCKDRFGSSLNENFALLKPTWQTSTKGDASASRAADGDTNPYFGNGSCSQTDPGDDLVWQVNLEEDIYVTSVTLTTRVDQYWSSLDFYYVYGKSSGLPDWKCGERFFPNTGESITVECDMPKKANKIEIRHLKTEGILSLCEVEVHGRKFNHYENEVNYALRKPAKQSSTHIHTDDNGDKLYCVANLASNGDRNTNFYDGSCQHMNCADSPHYWSVDLGKIITVNAVTITSPSIDMPVRISNFDVRVGFAEKYDDEDFENCVGHILGFGTNETRTIFCTNPIRGRYVAIRSFKTDCFHLCEVSVYGEELECAAPEPFGFETFKIQDSQFQASSSHTDSFSPHDARLNFRGWYGNPLRRPCWASGNGDTEPWIQVDFFWIVTVTGVLIQGRYDSDQWVKSFAVSSKVDGMDFLFYMENGQKKTFTANTDRNTIVRQNLIPPVVARWFRVHPVTWEGHCSLRLELIGCQNRLHGTRPPQNLGMVSRQIRDSQLTASSVHNNYHTTTRARLHFGRLGWRPANLDGSWFQVDFLLTCVVFEIKTQGSGGTSDWVKTYKVSYSIDSEWFDRFVENGAVKNFVANTDSETIVINTLVPAIVARAIRIYPTSWKNQPVLRTEFVGIYRETSIARPLGMQDRSIERSQISFSSAHYHADGRWESPWLNPDSGQLDDHAWVPYHNNEEQWLQVDFLRSTKVTEIKTQGRPYFSVTYQQWVTSYEIAFGNDGENFRFCQRYGKNKVFRGNWDYSSVNSQSVSPAIVSRYIRIYPRTHHLANAMRVEFVGYHIVFQESCQTPGPLGMEDYRISKYQLSASSEYEGLEKHLGRLNGQECWAAKHLDMNQWYQVDFTTTVRLLEIHTQGRPINNGNQWVKQYTVSYGYRPDRIDSQFYQQDGQTKVFEANYDGYSIVRNVLLPAIVARIVRLHIQSWNDHISMRTEFFGAYEVPRGPALIDPDYIALENRLIASSCLDLNHQAIHGIISYSVSATSWIPAHEKGGEYIQVDLAQLTPISGVGLITSGDPSYDYTEVMMQYSDTEEGEWKIKRDYRGEIMTLSTLDCDTKFEKLVVARYVRLVITAWGCKTGFVFQLYGTTDYHKASAGIEDGSVKDSQMKSSNHPNDPNPAHEARLNHAGGWCGNTLRRHLYLQIDFLSNFEVHAVATQAKSGGIMDSVTQYKLSSTLDDVQWNLYEEEGQTKIFNGSANCKCSRKHVVQPFLVRSLRFLPTLWNDRPCMRVEAYGIYKGILKVHVRSGPVFDGYGRELTRSCSIKLNGEEVSKSVDGINLVVADYITGSLITSRSTAEYSLLNNLLLNIKNESVIVLATQNVEERPPEDTLNILQSLGGIKLRYSLTSEHDNWIVLGYKGKHKVDWITEKVGKMGEAAIRIASTVHLNSIASTPEFHKHYMPDEKTTNTNISELSIAGRFSFLDHKITSRCGAANLHCQPGLSLAMWMKHDMPEVNRYTSKFLTEERFVFKYYANGYNYIIPKLSLNWIDSRKYCLSMGADLPVLLEKETELTINDFLTRAEVSQQLNLGLQRHPVTSEFEWVDGSPYDYMNWRSDRPNSNECTSRYASKVWDSLGCLGHLRPVICQQPIEDVTGLVAMGLEQQVIPDMRMESSTELDDLHPASYGRVNDKRGLYDTWCATDADNEPYLQADLGEIRKICGVGTQGRGKASVDPHKAWPTSYNVKFTNDSSTWIFMQWDGANKVFEANDDYGSVVINRFHQPVMAQIVQLKFLTWNTGFPCCARMEVFACSNPDKEKKTRETPQPKVPRSITVIEPENCLDVLVSGKTTDGVYVIKLGNEVFPVYCDQTTDGGGWTVLQRRIDGTVDFYRNYEEYETGFGDVSGEHWLGLSKMTMLTHSYSNDLKVELKNFNVESFQTLYTDVMIAAKKWGYKFTFYQHLNDKSMNSLGPHKGALFSAKDKGDFKETAVRFKGGWWYKMDDRDSNLNGIYYAHAVRNENGIFWLGFDDTNVLKETKMMIRPNGGMWVMRGRKEGALSMVDWHTYKSTTNKLVAVDAKLGGNSRLDLNSIGTTFFQGDFFEMRIVTHISTQGGTNSDFVKQYYLKFSVLKGSWMDYKENGVLKIFEGNNERTQSDASHIVSNCLKQTEPAKMIRIFPTACEGSCSLKFEVYSCLESCSKPVNVQDPKALDHERMIASSTKSNSWRGRLHYKTFWQANSQRVNQFLEIRLYDLLKVTSVATQGGTNCWVKSFGISYRDENIKWKKYKGRNGETVFSGNRNKDTVVRTHFDLPFLAYSVRFVAKTWHKSVCMRTEIYGCHPDDKPFFEIYTKTAHAGKNVRIMGKYRYCVHNECPGCLKSLWIRVFGQEVLVKDFFSYDCQYHEFEVDVKASVVPGSHKAYIGASESPSIAGEKLRDERFVGTITVTQEFHLSCLDLLLSGQTKSGVYEIAPDGETAFQVYCDQEKFGGGWTVFQKRVNDLEDFNRAWTDYKAGFGNLSSNFWLGNDNIHKLTIDKRELLLDLDSIAGDHSFILYKSFQIENEDAFYKLHVSEYQHSVGDCLQLFNGKKFSTMDNDRDTHPSEHCAQLHQGGWWYAKCGHCLLNGLFDASADSSLRFRMNMWQGSKYLSGSEMKLRNREVVTCNDHYCYYLLKSIVRWNVALAGCRRFNADLLSIRDSSENEWIVDNILKTQAISSVHLGMYNTTHWTDGSVYVYNNFANLDSIDGCPFLRMDGVWDVGDCGNITHTLCKRAKFCYKDTCQVFSTETMDYNAAENYCRNIGYDMAKIHGEKKNNYVVKILNSLTLDNAWIKPYIGLRRSNAEFGWCDGTRLAFENWNDGEPDDASNECIEMENTGSWTDASCSSLMAPVCEKVYSPEKRPIDCLELLLSGKVRSGIYTIDPDGEGPRSVYCDQENFGGGWTLLLRHLDYNLKFEFDWQEYKRGFGGFVDGNFWLGNDFIHTLTRITNEVLFDLNSELNDKAFVLYKTFKVADESDKYKLTIGDYQTSAAGDAMTGSNDVYFSTQDQDNSVDLNDCANTLKGGWWYHSCDQTMSSLTAKYATFSQYRKLIWQTWTSHKVLSKVEMKTRSKSVVSCTDHFCYYRINKKLMWAEAVKECRKFNADLVSIRSEADQQWLITGILTPQSIDEIYIGLGIENTEKWTDDSPANFKKLSVIPSDKCVIMKQDGSWDVVDCTQAKYVVCKRGKFCLNGDCYISDEATLGFVEVAQEYCNNSSYSIAKISSEQESMYAADLIRQTTLDDSFLQSFIGIQLVGGSYQWSDYTKPQYTNWGSGEPTGSLKSASIRDDTTWTDLGPNEKKYALCKKGPIIESCSKIRRHGRKGSGFFSISAGAVKRFTVYCDLSNNDSPWTVIQRRLYGSEPTDYHSKSWADYKNGFKSDEMNFWLGNKYIHELTRTPQRLKILITTEEFHTYEAVYENFTIQDEASGFQIHFGSYSGTAGDSLSKQRGKRFSTTDQGAVGISCGSNDTGSWWFVDCDFDSNLNGMFATESNDNQSIFWRTIKEKIIKTEMKIQPYHVSNTHVSGAIHIADATLAMSFNSDTSEIKVRTSSEEWTTFVSSPGPFVTHVAITWQEDGNLRYYENGSLRAESSSVVLAEIDKGRSSTSVHRECMWLNELTLWNFGLLEFNARSQYSTRNFTFEDDGYLWTFENSSQPYSWQMRHSCTPTELTGPCGDHTYLSNLGTFIFAEASKPAKPNDRAVVISPNLPGCYRCLKFWIHMLGQKFGSLNIHFNRDANVTDFLEIPVFSIVESYGNSWRYMQVNVDAINVFQIAMEAKRADGSTADIALDDVMLTTTSCEKECHPPCKFGERCDPLSLLCVYEGYYDHRWRLDSLDIVDDKGMTVGQIYGDVLLQSDGVIENCTALRGDGKIEFQDVEERCDNPSSFPLYTLSLWLKYKEMNSQTIISVGKFLNITQSANAPDKEHISVEASTTKKKCVTSFFVPSEVWSHIIVSVNALKKSLLVYLDGSIVKNSLNFVCTDHNEVQSYENASLVSGGNGDVDFALDDVRLLFDAPEMSETIKSFTQETGSGQIISIQAEVETQTWNDDLLYDDSESYKQLSLMIKTKIMETFQNRSKIKDVVVVRFIQGSVVADINIIYDKLTYQDILFVEEAIYLNNTFNGLNVQAHELNSTSVPNVSPAILTYIAPNMTTIYLNWTEMSSFYLNGIFQGYKVLHRVTENSSYTEYTVEVLYGNKTEAFLYDMEVYTNYTLRVLAFTLSGDGLISDSVTVVTLDGAPEAPNVTVTNVSSTALYVNWTMLPNSTSFYKQLQGYFIEYWEESKEDNIYNLTQFKNDFLFENLKKWTVYCFNVTSFTYGKSVTSETQCARTFEDVPEEPPENVTVLNFNVTAIELSWLPPNESAVPGIVRYYNLSYRILNDSRSEITTISVESSTLTYTIADLTGLSLVQINITAFTVASGPVHTMMAMTEEGVPLVAPNLTAINVSSISYKVNWTRIPKVYHNGILLGFRLFFWKQVDGEESARNVTYGKSVSLVQFDGVAKWTVFCAQIAGFTAVGDGPRSTVECATTFEDAPDAPPIDLRATDVRISRIDLEWSSPPLDLMHGILRRYNLTYRNLNYTDELLTEEYFDPPETSYTMENLIGLTLYEINVTATTILPGPWATLYVLTEEGVPSIAPPNATWFNTSSTSLEMEWSMLPRPSVNGIVTGYRIFIWKESTGAHTRWIITVPPMNVTSGIVDLEKYTRYCGQIEAFTRIGTGPRSPVVCMRTSEDAAEKAPSGPKVSNITWNECHLSWKQVSPSFIPGVLRAYRITYRITDPRFDQSNKTFLVDSRFNSTVVTGLLGFVDYQVMVNGYTVKDGPVSVSYFKTKEGVPTSPPSGFLKTSVTPTTITVGWEKIPLPERHGIILGYELTYQKTSTRSKREVEKTLTYDANTYTAFIFQLTPYTNYTITLRGRTSVGLGAQGEIVIETLQGTPSIPPKGFGGVNFTGPTTIFVSWGALTQAELQGVLSSYEVRYQAFSMADEELIDPPPEEVIHVNAESIYITGLTTYTTYRVSVKAVSGGGNGVTSFVEYVATCRCHKTLKTNYWNIQPYVNVTGDNRNRGFFPHLLDMVTLYCCEYCLEHGTTDIDYFHDGKGDPSEKVSDIDVKRNVILETDYSFPVYGFFGQTIYNKYFGYAAIVDVVGTVFFTRKPDASEQATALLASIMSIMPFLAITIIFAYIAGVIMWALERGSNKDEFPPTFTRGAPNGFWWAYISMTTVGYGDKTARTVPGRIFAVIWVMMGLVIGGLLIGSIASAFTSSTSAPDDQVKMLYGANVGALQDSPDHKLGVRRTAEVNKLKKYLSLEELRQDLRNKKVDGILVDSYVSDSRRELFSDFSIKQVIDLQSSYGVVMGADAMKIRKCINKYWKENAAMRANYIKENVKPVEVIEMSAADAMAGTFDSGADMYQLTLRICLILFVTGIVCGCIYEIIRRKRRAKRVVPVSEDLPTVTESNLQEKLCELQEKLKSKITEIKTKHKEQIIALGRSKLKKKKSGNHPDEEKDISTEIPS